MGLSFFVVFVTESYEVLGDRLRRKVDRMIPQFMEVWSKYDPEGTGRLRLPPNRDSGELVLKSS